MLKVSVEYSDALGNLDSVRLSLSVGIPCGEGPAESHRPNMDVIKVVELTRTAVAKDQVVDALDKGDLRESRRILEERLNALHELQRTYGEPDAEVDKESRELENLLAVCSSAPEGRSPYAVAESSMRKDLRYESYLRRRGKPESGNGPAD